VGFGVPSDAGAGVPQNTYMTVARIDYNLSDKTTLFGRYALYSENDFPGSVDFSPYAGYDTGQKSYNNNLMLNLTHVFTPNFVSQTKLVYNRLNNLQPLGTNPVGPTLYYGASGVPSIGSSALIGPGYSEYTPGNAIPFGGPQNLYQIYQDISWTKGKHQFRFGGQYIQTRDNRTFGAYEEAVEALNQAGDYATSVDNLVAGQLGLFESAIDPQGKYPCVRYQAPTPGCEVTTPVSSPSFSRNNRYNDGAWYVQDSWKLSPRLTLNLGVRWEYDGLQHNANPTLD
jgi:outer membrane receptor protein involved in Fe transport